jgi:hypothetical protein
MIKTESIKEIAAAMAKAQGVVKKATKNRTNPHFKSKFADLESVWDACREALTKNGLSVVQSLGSSTDGKPQLTTILMHTSGEFIENSVLLPVLRVGAQDIGSALTYMKRYSLAALIGIADSEDDDGEAAMERPKPMSQEMRETRAAQVKDPGLYFPKFGKYAGRPLDSIRGQDQLKELYDYVEHIRDEAKKKNKPIKGDVAEFIDFATKYLDANVDRPAALEVIDGRQDK